MAPDTARPVLLALRALGLGDLLAGIPALRALADAFPDHHRVLAAPAPVAALALHSGAVDEVVPTEGLVSLHPRISEVDVAVNLHGRGPQSHRVLLRAAPRRLLAFRHADVPQTEGFPEWRAQEHEVIRWCRMLRESGIEADASGLDLDPPPGDPPPGCDGATLIHPGAASGSRRWPPDRWAAVARSEHAAGRPVVITGGPGEVALAREVATAAGLPEERVLAGRTDLLDLARAVAAAGRVVCGDTGVSHLATALRTPSVVLFGPTPPGLWGPPKDRPIHRVLWKGGTGDPHGSDPDPALLAIRVDEVTAALEDVCLAYS